MEWKFEWLDDIAAVNDSNVTYPLTKAPILASLRVSFPFSALERVESAPAGLQYAIAVNVLTLGIAPASGTRPWAQYLWE